MFCHRFVNSFFYHDKPHLSNVNPHKLKSQISNSRIAIRTNLKSQIYMYYTVLILYYVLCISYIFRDRELWWCCDKPWPVGLPWEVPGAPSWCQARPQSAARHQVHQGAGHRVKRHASLSPPSSLLPVAVEGVAEVPARLWQVSHDTSHMRSELLPPPSSLPACGNAPGWSGCDHPDAFADAITVLRKMNSWPMWVRLASTFVMIFRASSIL